jgi:HlyD family secretion protein
MPKLASMRDTSAQDVKKNEPSKLTGRYMWTAISLVIIVSILWFILPALNRLISSERTISLQQIQVATVEQGDLQRDVAVQGKVVAAISPTLFAPSAGTVSLHFKAGDSVNQGDIIATIDSPEIESEYAQQKAMLEETELEYRRQEIVIKTALLDNQQNIELALVDFELATKNKVRADINIKLKVISQVEYEQNQAELKKIGLQHKHAIQNAKLKKENYDFELQAKKLQLDRQEFVVSELDRQVKQLKVVSPITGVIGNVLVNEKDAVNRNAPVMTVVDLTAFEIEINIPETYADDLGVGLKAQITLDDKNFVGELTAISPEVTNGQVSGRIRFEQKSPQGLRQNQRISIRILIESRDNVIKVQRGSFVETSGGRYVFVIKDDIAVKRNIQLGARSLSEIEVISGLQKGEKIIISSVEQFADTQQIYLSK